MVSMPLRAQAKPFAGLSMPTSSSVAAAAAADTGPTRAAPIAAHTQRLLPVAFADRVKKKRRRSKAEEWSKLIYSNLYKHCYNKAKEWTMLAGSGFWARSLKAAAVEELRKRERE